jgi:hypothetical protein
VTSTDQPYWIAAARDISQRGVKVVSVLIDPHSFGYPRSNRDLVTELAVSGMPTYYIREGDDLTLALAEPYAQAVPLVGRAV